MALSTDISTGENPLRCLSCDKILSDLEDAAKFIDSGAYVGLCTDCRRWLPTDVAYTSFDDSSEIPPEDDVPLIDTQVDDLSDEDLL